VKNLRRLLPFLLAAGVALCVHVGAAALPQAGQKFDQKIFGEMRWRSIGPFRAGRSLAVTGVRGQPDVYYFGSVGGGVWKTNDAGRTWNPIFDAEPIASIGAMAVAPSNPNVIYVGSGEADMRSSISYGNGMYRSIDAGKTWTHIGLDDSRQIARILVDPDDAEKVFVAALGHAYGPNKERGIFRSSDGGKTWQPILFKDENTGAIDLAMEPGNPKNMYAALLQTRRPPWSIYPPSKGPGTGLYHSKDGGEHWEQLTGHGLPSEELGRMGIAFAPSNPKRMYLIADAKEGGLYRSDDGGETWVRVSKDARIWGRGWYFCEVSVDSKDPDTVYVPNTSTYRSRDGGKTFTAIKGAPGGDDYHQLWIDPDNPLRMVLGCDQGVIVTRNGGETWSSWYNQASGQFYHVATDNRFPFWVYGAQQDSGAAATPSRSNSRALNAQDWRPTEAGGESDYVAPDPLNPEIIFGGSVVRQDFHNEQVQQIPPTLMYPGEYRRTWTLPLVFSEIEPHVLYFSAQVLFRTADGGSSWQKISPDLTREDPGVPSNLDPATAADAPASKRRGVIYTIAPSPMKAGEIWVGTDDGLVHLTRDEGKTWNDVTPELTPWSKVTHIAASRYDAGKAYAAVDRHRLEDLQPYLYRTKDFGKTWQRVSSGIPEGSFLNCVREDPKVAGLLYACTEKGVYVSFDDGNDWQPLQFNLPTTSVRDLVVHGDDLVIATFGRAFWVLDDVTPLRQWSAKVASAEAWLFEPQTAYRARPGSDQGTPIPLDEPQAENPPTGAVIDYYLKEKQAAPVQLEILDTTGKLVRRFASTDEAPKTNPDELDIPMYWVHDAEPLSAEAGVHRFVWDLRYAFGGARRRSRRGGGGPIAVPGRYSAKLTAAGKTISVPLVVKMDPRVKTSAADLDRQFELASKLAAGVGEFSAAVTRADDLQKQIAARRKEAEGNAELAEAVADLEKKVSGVAGSGGGSAGFGSFGFTVPGDEPKTLRQMSAAMGTMLGIVESADVAPSADARAASEKWEAAGTATLARWDAIQTKDLARVNSLLLKAQLQLLKIGEEKPHP
jgi:photosystem II stability/assembly factor-like uncharacterized protein